MISPRVSGWQHYWQVEAESLNRSNELEEMQQKLEARKIAMGNVSMHSMVAVEDTKKKEEQLSTELRSLLVAGTALSVSRKRLEVKYIIIVGFEILEEDLCVCDI